MADVVSERSTDSGARRKGGQEELGYSYRFTITLNFTTASLSIYACPKLLLQHM